MRAAGNKPSHVINYSIYVPQNDANESSTTVCGQEALALKGER